MDMRRFVLIGVAGFAWACGGGSTTQVPSADEGQQLQAVSTYLEPPQVIVDILDAPPIPTATVSPSRDTVALLQRNSMASIAEVSRPVIGLAGSRINPKTNGIHQPRGITSITFKAIADGSERTVALPAGAIVQGGSFSPNGTWFAFRIVESDRIEPWVAEVATGEAHVVAADAALNGTSRIPCDWTDDETMLCRFVVANRGPAPASPEVPTGPNIQESSGTTAPVRTYQDLIDDEYEERLFEYYFNSQLAFVNVANGRSSLVGKPGLYEQASVSPDGQYLLVARTKRPFSRFLSASGFPKDVEVWNRQGDLVKTIADLPVAETVPINGVLPGPRNYRWRPLEPASLVWVEALDGGDPRAEVPHRDRVMTLSAPFTGTPVEALKTEYRFGSLTWTQGGTALATESDRTIRRTRTWILDPGATAPRKLWDRNTQDAYADPGTPATKMTASGPVVIQNGDTIYLTGRGASPNGDRPFFDALNLSTLQTERLFQSDETSHETVEAVLTDDATSVLTQYETPTDPPNYFVRDFTAGDRRALTAFTDPAPQLRGVKKQLVTYARNDGVRLSGTLYLPPDYRAGQRLPILMWAYPREFGDPSTAGQVTGSPNRFTTIGWSDHLLLLTQGYAVFDDPKMPIVGPGETANDTYVEQLVASAQAAVDQVVRMGVADRDRIGVGGHSYGSFMTANLLAHSDLFRAGVARSGAFNRSLTPFGFQREARTFWEVPQLYARMSPFWYAHKINEPTLLIHGEVDSNPGTFPIQSERMYMAIKGHGGTVRYVTLPHENHGYQARESVLHVMAETVAWLDAHVKNAKPRRQLTQNLTR